MRYYGYRYLGADEYAVQLNAKNPERVRTSAAKMFVNEMKAAITRRESMIVESTLAGFSLVKHVKKAVESGYKILCVYIYLDSVDIATLRVKLRVRQGGHDVPEVDIRRRFPRSRLNFWKIYRPICHSWELYYNSPEEQYKSIDLVAYAELSLDKLSEKLKIIDRQQYALFIASVELKC